VGWKILNRAFHKRDKQTITCGNTSPVKYWRPLITTGMLARSPLTFASAYSSLKEETTLN
jgi:hypothetical protein